MRKIYLGFWLVALASSSISVTLARTDEVKPLVKIGVLTDLRGVLSDASGQGSIVATQLAVADYKAAGGLLPVEVISGDYQNKADVGTGIAREWFDLEAVDAVVDIANSSVALAVADLAKDKNRVLLATGPGSTELTGARCSPNTVQWYDNYMLASAIVNALLQEQKKRWFFVTADYTFGHDLQRLASGILETGGGTVVGSIQHPIGTSDFSSFLLTAANPIVDVVAIASSGDDVINAIKQAHEFGVVTDKRVLATFIATVLTINAVGIDTAQGLFVTEPFYWNTDDKTREFSGKFYKQLGKMPNFVQAGAYSATLRYLAVREQLFLAGKTGTDGRSTIAAMKSEPFVDPLFGATSIRSDGRAVHRTYLFQVKKPDEVKTAWDFFREIRQISGDRSILPISPLCTMAK